MLSELEIVELKKKSDVDAIADYVKKMCGGVSFVELEHLFDALEWERKGGICVCLPKFENIVLWFGMNERFSNAVIQAMAQKKIYPHPTNYLVYLFDGAAPSMPLAKKAFAYKKPHWMPVCFNPKPWEQR